VVLDIRLHRLSDWSSHTDISASSFHV
jgi:hypothetical protein